MKLLVVRGRAPKTAWADEAAVDYGRRIQRYFPFEEVMPRAEGSEAVVGLVGERGWLVALDERGEDAPSEELARWIEQAAGAGRTRLVFAIGGAGGHPPEVRGAAWRVLRLSAMVLNHAVARVVLLEQLYRACTIRAGEPYHRG